MPLKTKSLKQLLSFVLWTNDIHKLNTKYHNSQVYPPYQFNFYDVDEYVKFREQIYVFVSSNVGYYYSQDKFHTGNKGYYFIFSPPWKKEIDMTLLSDNINLNQSLYIIYGIQNGVTELSFINDQKLIWSLQIQRQKILSLLQSFCIENVDHYINTIESFLLLTDLYE